MLSTFSQLWFNWRLRRGVRAIGTVVEQVPDGKNGQRVIRFQDQYDNLRLFTTNTWSSWDEVYGLLPVGTQVEVVYLPTDPSGARLLIDTAKITADTSFEGRASFIVTTLLGINSQENRHREKLRRYGIRTTGTVNTILPDEFKTKYGFPHLHPKIQFENERGEVFSFVDTSATIRVGNKQVALPEIGEQVPIVYLPDAPHVARRIGAARSFSNFAIRLCGGLLVLALGLFIRSRLS